MASGTNYAKFFEVCVQIQPSRWEELLNILSFGIVFYILHRSQVTALSPILNAVTVKLLMGFHLMLSQVREFFYKFFNYRLARANLFNFDITNGSENI